MLSQPYPNSGPPAVLLPWLTAQGSLTRQLTDLAGGQFRVACCQQGYRPLSRELALWLGVRPGMLAWQRESLLYGAGQEPWVKALSLFPVSLVQGQGRRFRHLREQPVGRVLFERTQPRCQRRIRQSRDGWTRQSRYSWHGHQLIVAETFLPPFVAYLQQRIQPVCSGRHHSNGLLFRKLS